MTQGPGTLTNDDKTRLLVDPTALSWVHSDLWLAGLDAAYAPLDRKDDGSDADNSRGLGYAAAA